MAFWKSPHAAPVRSYEFRVQWNGVLSHTVKSCSKPTVEVNGSEYQVGNQIFKYPGVAKWNDVTLTFVDDKTTTRNIFQQLINQGLLIPVGQKQYGGMDGQGATAEQKAYAGDAAMAWSDRTEKELAAFNASWAANNFESGMTGRQVSQVNESLPNPRFSGWTDDSMKKGKVGDIVIEQHGVLTSRTVVPDTPGSLWRPPIKGGSRQLEKNGPGAGPFILESWTLKNAWIKSINFGELDYSSDELITIEVTISYDWCEVDFPVAPQSDIY